MFKIIGNQILEEVSQVINGVDELAVNRLIDSILDAKTIVTCGAGRMGMMAKAFAMRLSHLGHRAFHIQDCNTPRIGSGDLLLVSSGSGETKTIVTLAQVAKQHEAQIALVTTRKESSLASLADVKVVLPAPSKVESTSFSSIQPMTTLTEQSSLIFFDTLVMLLMQRQKQTNEMLKTRHSILE